MMVNWEDIVVKQGGVETTPCDCCGTKTRLVKGDLVLADEWIGFYWVRWTEGHPDVLPIFHLGTGNWSDTADVSDRWVVAVEYHNDLEGFHAVDFEQKGTSATYLDRQDWVGSSFAAEAFAMFDAVFMKDDRLTELHP